eukprot:CAMPEP_0116567460 /NCGR_PEP_ID=MMETSP0397-20121206/15017_1 /TAXON_ID=216820 /ORGANISM="Cyclophora tenuis, Strain ECT3854" /LENGTH=286 /DNA_ID=CAMNT_0004094449 /DNA_START=46 /DNA_END=906 /DNA_ORIENTATION=-
MRSLMRDQENRDAKLDEILKTVKVSSDDIKQHIDGLLLKVLNHFVCVQDSSVDVEQLQRDNQHILQICKEMAREQNDMSQQMERLRLEQASGVAAVASGLLRCPRLMLLIRIRSGRNVAKRALYRGEYSLYFLCAHDLSLVPTTIIVKDAQEWVKVAAPLLKMCIVTLKVLAVVAQVIPIPNLPDFLPGDTVHQKFDSLLRENGDLLSIEELNDVEKWRSKFEYQVEFGKLMKGMESTISAEACNALVLKAYKPKHIAWMDKMVIGKKGDVYAWVKKTNKAAFESS